LKKAFTEINSAIINYFCFLISDQITEAAMERDKTFIVFAGCHIVWFLIIIVGNPLELPELQPFTD
jgi:hypothetical protein